MGRRCLPFVACLLGLAACAAPDAPNGPLTDYWSWRNTDSSAYVRLDLTEAGSHVQGEMLYRLPSGGGGFTVVSAAYVDSSFTVPLGMACCDQAGEVFRIEITGKLSTIDSLIGVVRNLFQLGTDTLVFTRTTDSIPAVILPGIPPVAPSTASDIAGHGRRVPGRPN